MGCWEQREFLEYSRSTFHHPTNGKEWCFIFTGKKIHYCLYGRSVLRRSRSFYLILPKVHPQCLVLPDLGQFASFALFRLYIYGRCKRVIVILFGSTDDLTQSLSGANIGRSWLALQLHRRALCQLGPPHNYRRDFSATCLRGGIRHAITTLTRLLLSLFITAYKPPRWRADGRKWWLFPVSLCPSVPPTLVDISYR